MEALHDASPCAEAAAPLRLDPPLESAIESAVELTDWDCPACGSRNGSWQRNCYCCDEANAACGATPFAAPATQGLTADQFTLRDIVRLTIIAAGCFWVLACLAKDPVWVHRLAHVVPFVAYILAVPLGHMWATMTCDRAGTRCFSLAECLGHYCHAFCTLLMVAAIDGLLIWIVAAVLVIPCAAAGVGLPSFLDDRLRILLALSCLAACWATFAGLLWLTWPMPQIRRSTKSFGPEEYARRRANAIFCYWFTAITAAALPVVIIGCCW